jgi:hypothetical protein
MCRPCGQLPDPPGGETPNAQRHDCPLGRVRRERAYRRRQVQGDVRRLDRRSRGVLGRAWQAHRLDQALHQGEGCQLRAGQHLDQVVRGRHAERLLQLRRPPCRDARRPDGDHLGAGRPERRGQAHHLSRAAERSLQDGQYPRGHGRAERRPRHPLPADDPRGGLRDAGLRTDRRDPLHRLRGLLPRRARRADQRLRRQGRDHRRRGPARRPQDGAEIEHRRRASERAARGQGAGGQAHRRADHVDRRARLRLQRAALEADATRPRRR